MKQVTTLLFAALLMCSCQTKEEYELVWSDEFNYNGLPDPQKWNYDTEGNAYGWGNNELQVYTVEREENASVNGEYLFINALNENWGDYNYTSARLTTKGKGDWLYGRIEVMAKLPSGRGTWPAIWMLPADNAYGEWPKSGEIDIMEHVGYDPDSIHATVHTATFNHIKGTQKGKSFYVSNSERNFHLYAIEWFPEKIDFFFDKTKVFTFKNTLGGSDEWPFDKPFYLILNVAIGGNWGGVQGVDNNIFPASMEVDYVRVYKRNDSN